MCDFRAYPYDTSYRGKRFYRCNIIWHTRYSHIESAYQVTLRVVVIDIFRSLCPYLILYAHYPKEAITYATRKHLYGGGFRPRNYRHLNPNPAVGICATNIPRVSGYVGC